MLSFGPPDRLFWQAVTCVFEFGYEYESDSEWVKPDRSLIGIDKILCLIMSAIFFFGRPVSDMICLSRRATDDGANLIVTPTFRFTSNHAATN